MVTKARQLAEFIANADVDSDEIATGAVSASKLAATLDLSSKTIVMPDVASFNITSGDVGIGTSSPSSLIHLSGAAASGGAVEIRLEDTAASSNSRLMRTGSAYSYAGVGANETWFYHAGAGTINIGPDGAGVVKIVNNGSERMRIDSIGRVGIGNSSPQHRIHFGVLNGYYTSIGSGNRTPGGAEPWLGVFDNSNIASATHGWGFYDSNSDGSFQIWNKNNSTTAYNTFTIKRGGNVGIGTTSPSNTFTVNGGSESIGVTISDTARLTIGADGTWNYFKGKSGNGHYFNTTGGGLVVFNNAGNVGIGTSSPVTSYGRALQIHNPATTGSNLRLTNSTTGEGTGNGFELIQLGVDDYIINREAGAIITYTNGGEVMRIDSSGNLLVGKTSADTYNNTNGIELQASGLLTATRTGIAQILNREDSDGDIAVFRKDGTTVGSIGTDSNGDFVIDGSANHSGLRFKDNTIVPKQNGSDADNAIDLGKSDKRWKDLHLSGTANVGGIVKSTANTVTASTSATTIDMTASNFHVVTMQADTTFTLSNLANAVTSSGTIVLKQDSTGGRDFTLPSSCKTPVGGATITQYTGANSTSVLSYMVVSSTEVLVNYIGNFA